MNSSNSSIPLHSISQYFLNISCNTKKCKLCDKVISAQNSERYWSHLMNNFKNNNEEIKEIARKKRVRDEPDEDMIKKKVYSEQEVEAMNESICKFIISSCIPFSICDNQEWKDMWKPSCPGFMPPSSKIIGTRLNEIYLAFRLIKMKLKMMKISKKLFCGNGN